ncbi:hypothetical protein AAZX31_10G266400 [Glycine max]|uniref:Uncharacterized protein n=2 Tax=Glycine subgen. Soja TaxID=1462606 RepID=I1LF37_SOYBN|nr:hypothetical protein GLYMA_10G280900v4 [Glycine max]RZB89513.1 hypothetical protein D0Y65_028370 [Glycine soja]
MEDADAYAVGMNPWEQHSGVIKLPRYDYNSPSSLLFSSLLRNSHSDFLITCTISSVNSLTSLHSHSSPSNLPFHFFNSSFHSATKEAISILHKFVAYDSSNNPKEEGTSSKKRKLCTQDTADECFDHKDTESASANSAEDGIHFFFADYTMSMILMAGVKAEGEKDGVACLSLVKLTRNGLLLLNFPSNTPPNTVNIVSNIIQALESGTVTLPVWCQSHFPYPSYLQFERKRTTRSSIKAC